MLRIINICIFHSISLIFYLWLMLEKLSLNCSWNLDLPSIGCIHDFLWILLIWWRVTFSSLLDLVKCYLCCYADGTFFFFGFTISIMKADQSILERLNAPMKAPNWPVGTDDPWDVVTCFIFWCLLFKTLRYKIFVLHCMEQATCESLSVYAIFFLVVCITVIAFISSGGYLVVPSSSYI